MPGLREDVQRADLDPDGPTEDEGQVARSARGSAPGPERVQGRRDVGCLTQHGVRWRHRFLQQAQPVKASDLVGVVEADETYFLRSSKGQKVVGRKSRKRGGKASKRGLSDEQLPVLVVRDRSGATADFILPAASKITLAAALEPIVHKDAVLCTDGSPAMAAAAHQLGIQHEAVNLAQGIRIRGPWHIQNANAYRGRLKNWLRRFQGVAISYLGSYLAWFGALDRASKTPSNLAPILALAIGRGARH